MAQSGDGTRAREPQLAQLPGLGRRGGAGGGGGEGGAGNRVPLLCGDWAGPGFPCPRAPVLSRVGGDRSLPGSSTGAAAARGNRKRWGGTRQGAVFCWGEAAQISLAVASRCMAPRGARLLRAEAGFQHGGQRPPRSPAARELPTARAGLQHRGQRPPRSSRRPGPGFSTADSARTEAPPGQGRPGPSDRGSLVWGRLTELSLFGGGCSREGFAFLLRVGSGIKNETPDLAQEHPGPQHLITPLCGMGGEKATVIASFFKNPRPPCGGGCPCWGDEEGGIQQLDGMGRGVVFH